MVYVRIRLFCESSCGWMLGEETALVPAHDYAAREHLWFPASPEGMTEETAISISFSPEA